MMASGYPAEVWTRFRAPARAGAPANGAQVGTGGARRQGGEIEVWLAVADGRVTQAGFRAFGCPYAVALADLCCERLAGQPIDALLEFDAEALMQSLQVPPERFPIRIWLEDAVRGAARATRGSPQETP